jgi:hypothetical protein
VSLVKTSTAKRRPVLLALAATAAVVSAAAIPSSAAATANSPASINHTATWDLVNAWWSNAGATLSLIPNAAGASLATVDAKRLLNDAINLAGARTFQTSVYNSLWNQLRCHSYFGWRKATPQWNLDTWRPDVGFWSTVFKRCNP